MYQKCYFGNKYSHKISFANVALPYLVDTLDTYVNNYHLCC